MLQPDQFDLHRYRAIVPRFQHYLVWPTAYQQHRIPTHDADSQVLIFPAIPVIIYADA